MGVPASFNGYFTAAAAAGGVLIGLLCVAVSLRPETIFGDEASAAGRAQAGSAFTCLVNCFFVSLVVTWGTGQVSNLAYLQIALFGVALRLVARAGKAPQP